MTEKFSNIDENNDFSSSDFPHSKTFGNTSNIPTSLLIEVEELLEKERTLMELRLLEQTEQSEHWKSKYDELKEYAIEDALEEKTEQFALEKLEALAEMTMKDPPPATVKDANSILISRVTEHYADLSNIYLNKTIFIYLSRTLFGTRSIYANVRIINLKDCDLGIDHIEPLVHILRSPRCDAINLSYNHLTEEMLFKMMEVLRVSVYLSDCSDMILLSFLILIE
jgi:hypothetical protein